jgi:hypothetical protein
MVNGMTKQCDKSYCLSHYHDIVIHIVSGILTLLPNLLQTPLPHHNPLCGTYLVGFIWSDGCMIIFFANYSASWSKTQPTLPLKEAFGT